MNYSDLAQKLLRLAERLEKHSAKIEGEALARPAGKISNEADRLEAALDSFLASRKSGELILETLLRSPSAKKHLSVDALRKILRDVADKRLKSEDLAEAKREFIEIIHRREESEEAAKALKKFFAHAVEVPSGGKEKAALQREFIQFGSLADDEFAKEVAKRTFGELRRLADANGIRFTDKTTKPRLILLVRRYSQRAVLNISAAA
jgi:hypothetical protein